MDSESGALEGLQAAQGVWGNLLTPSQLNQLGIPTPQNDREAKRPKKAETKTKGRQPSSTSQETVTVPKQVLTTLTKLVLRHEDSLNVLMQESEFLIHMSPGQGSILPALLQKSKDWHGGDKLVSLRHTLAVTMMKTLADRLAKLIQAEPTAELYQECVRLHLINEDKDKTMPYLRWNEQKRCLQPNNTPGLPVQAVERSLTNILRMLEDPMVTLRFHALMRPQEGMEITKSIPWLWTVSMRYPDLWHELTKLSYHSIWQLTQMQLRPQNLNRQPLAKLLQKTM